MADFTVATEEREILERGGINYSRPPKHIKTLAAGLKSDNEYESLEVIVKEREGDFFLPEL